jgi:hypothetical protein
MQSSTLAAYSGLYLPSIKCHWEIEGVEGLLKTEPDRHNISLLEYVYETVYKFSVRVLPIEIQQGKTNSLANHIYYLGSALR